MACQDSAPKLGARGPRSPSLTMACLATSAPDPSIPDAVRLTSTRDASDPPVTRTLLEALHGGLPEDGGLYVPAEWPRLPSPPDVADPLPSETAAWAAPLLLGEEGPGGGPARASGDAGPGDHGSWAAVARRALNFPTPRTSLGAGLELFELFHGPTLSFKDVGARFLAGTLTALGGGPRTILVATSGDTGGAVAHAVAGAEGLQAVILFPRDRVSPFQRRQFTTLGDRVRAVEVPGVFDDCQSLARQALADPAAREEFGLLSANSINPGRLLPQVFYYLHLARLRGWGRGATPRPAPVVVPSGNLGNLTAGVLAVRAGAPLDPLVAACNRNDVLVRFQADGVSRTVSVRPTASSAMDVGAPSNLERLEWLFSGDVPALRRGARAFRADPGEARKTMRWAWNRYGVLLDPHTAVGVAVARRDLPSRGGGATTVLATAHPAKFPEAVHRATGQTPSVPPGQPDEGAREEIVPLRGGLPELLGLLREWRR